MQPCGQRLTDEQVSFGFWLEPTDTLVCLFVFILELTLSVLSFEFHDDQHNLSGMELNVANLERTKADLSASIDIFQKSVDVLYAAKARAEKSG